MEVLLVYNPHAANGRHAGKMQAILARLRNLGIDATLVDAAAAGGTRKLLAGASLEGCDGVLIAGGDGTLFQAVNGLLERGEQDCPALGLIPLGTGNAFARELGLNGGDWQAAVDLVVRGRTQRVDVGEVTTSTASFRFVNIIHLGLTVDAARRAEPFKCLGGAAYSMGALGAMLFHRPARIELEVDGEAIGGEAQFVAISNSRYTGSRHLMAPQAKIDDGELDVILLRPLAQWRLANLFPLIFSGEHVHHPKVETWRGTRISFTSPAGTTVSADGERIAQSPIHIRCRPGRIRMFAPGGA